jgi:hypothetical protein
MSHAGHDDFGLDPGHASHDITSSDLSSATGAGIHAHDDGLALSPLGPGGPAHPAATATPEPTAQLGAAQEAGNPGEYQHYWFFQEHNGYCVPSSVTQVVEAQTGISLHGYNLVDQEAHHLGMKTGVGMSLQQAQKILAGFDIPSHLQDSASPQQATGELEHYLEQGRSIVLSVNASPIWYGTETSAQNTEGQADHALVVTAINTQTGEVTLSDPGSPNGNEEQVPYDTFMEAWAASHYQMLVSNDTAEGADRQAAATVVQDMEGGGGPSVLSDIGTGFGEAVGFVLLPVVLGIGLAAAATAHASRKEGGRAAGPRSVTA